MQYIDNLLDWGDALFAQDSIESINEATMLYILANDILGERPVKLGAHDNIADADLDLRQARTGDRRRLGVPRRPREPRP